MSQSSFSWFCSLRVGCMMRSHVLAKWLPPVHVWWKEAGLAPSMLSKMPLYLLASDWAPWSSLNQSLSLGEWVVTPPLELGEIQPTWMYVGREELDGSPEGKKVAECWKAGTAECLVFSKKLDHRRDREGSTPGGSCCHRLGHSSHLFRDSKK